MIISSKEDLVKFQIYMQDKLYEMDNNRVENFGVEEGRRFNNMLTTSIEEVIRSIKNYIVPNNLEMPTIHLIKASKRFLIDLQFTNHKIFLNNAIYYGDVFLDVFNEEFAKEVDQVDLTLNEIQRKDLTYLKNLVHDIGSKVLDTLDGGSPGTK